MTDMTYEQGLKELEKLAKSLESGELSLDESFETYQKAVGLIKFCHEKLESAKKEMTVLVEGLSGDMQEKVFHEDDYRG